MKLEKTCMFSIGIPAYKSLFLKECIDSILGQSYTDFELIVVNDASPFNVESVVSEYVDLRINYFRNVKNMGSENVVENWNKCLEQAKGRFFILMGDDDKMENNYLSEFVNLIEKYPTLDVYHCRSKIINQNSETIGLTPSWPEFESLHENLWHRVSGNRTQFISDFVFRTSVLKANNGFYNLPLAWASDDISVYIACGNKGIAHTNNPIFNYRKSPYTISASGSSELKMKAITLEHKWLTEFIKRSPTCQIDKLIHKNLCVAINHYISRKKVITIFESTRKETFIQVIRWFLRRRKFDYSLKIILYGIIGKV